MDDVAEHVLPVPIVGYLEEHGVAEHVSIKWHEVGTNGYCLPLVHHMTPAAVPPPPPSPPPQPLRPRLLFHPRLLRAPLPPRQLPSPADVENTVPNQKP
jgi:hypothetical protein